ncbi:MAG: DNA cytosine methyltransferase [Acidobacteriota bacterium]
MKLRDGKVIPVVDLFAGPGGLGEGFSAFHPSNGNSFFDIVLSIEKEAAAHQTLELRTLFRQFAPGQVPEVYYEHLRGEKTREELFAALPGQADFARKIAWHAELGKEDHVVVDNRIEVALGGAKVWVLCGGPPCQAYSVIGRARNRGIDADDPNVYLYREYLRILAEHAPPVFIMENVKGLLSSRVAGKAIFSELLAHLQNPRAAIAGAATDGPEYEVHSLVAQPRAWRMSGAPEYDPSDFVIKCEEYGIPQMRHRVILLGVKRDFAQTQSDRLRRSSKRIAAAQVLRGLPRLRSGLSKAPDGKSEWRRALCEILEPGVLDHLPNGESAVLKQDIGWTLTRMREPRADRGGEYVRCVARSDYLPRWYCDARIGGAVNHFARPHMMTDLHRYLFAACYARLFHESPELGDFPPGLLPKHKNVDDEAKKEYFDDRFRVQLADRPSTTITSHLAKDGHYFIHYDERQCRSLTVREAARLQTFPDNYLFCGTRTKQFVQVGNAVPPLLARKIAGVVARIVSSARRSND